MSELPERWKAVRIRDVVHAVENVDPTKTPQKFFKYIDIGSIDNQTQSIRAPKIILGKDAPSRARRRIHAGDVLFSTVRTYLKNIAVVPQELDGSVTSTGIAVLRPKDGIETEFLFNWTRSPEFLNQIGKAMDGTMYPAVTDRDVLDQAIPLPPIREQRRIVAKLGKLFEYSGNALEELARVPTLIERYKEATLAAAFRGQLTAKWRTERGLSTAIATRLVHEEPYQQTFRAPRDWSRNTIESICEIVGGSQPEKAKFKYEPQKGYIRLIQIRDYKSDQRATYVPTELARRFCSKDDVMIGRYGPPLFQILRGLEGAYNVALMKAVPLKGCLNEFLFYRLQDPDLRRYVEMGSDRTAGQDGVNKMHLLKYPIFMPCEEEQRVIVLRIQECFKTIKSLASESTRASELIKRLDQATLSKAFRGELSTQ
jgi:type I restriction enzyme, S subunit